MGDIVLDSARAALVQALTVAADQLSGNEPRPHLLPGSPLKAEDLPAISIGFPIHRVRPAGLGGVVGLHTGSGARHTLLGARLEGTLRVDLWVRVQGEWAEGLGELERLNSLVTSSLVEQKLRTYGILRLRHINTDEVKEAGTLPLWQVPGKGLTRSLTYDLCFEATFTPEEVEGLIKTVQVALAGPEPGDTFTIQADQGSRKPLKSKTVRRRR